MAQVPASPVPRSLGGNAARARSTNDSTMSGRDDAEAPACFSGESNDSHAEHQVPHSPHPLIKSLSTRCTVYLPTDFITTPFQKLMG